MVYPKHWKTRAESRKYDVNKMKTNIFICEWEGCINNACSIHHIESSYRGKKCNTNPYILIALCNNHHMRIHEHNNFDNRQILLDRVNFIIKYKNGLL